MRVGKAAVEAAVGARMKMEKYSSELEMEGVARLDLSPSQWFHVFLLALF